MESKAKDRIRKTLGIVENIGVAVWEILTAVYGWMLSRHHETLKCKSEPRVSIPAMLRGLHGEDWSHGPR
jgi:hypothetical protein